MAEDYTKGTFKVLNATITTRDPLVAMVLAHARSRKRLNAVLSMICEAHLNTPPGRVLASQLLQISLPELESNLAGAGTASQPVTAQEQLQTEEGHHLAAEGGRGAMAHNAEKSGVNFDNLISP